MVNLINRNNYLAKLLSYTGKELIKVISGLRRSGKSTLLALFKRELLKLDVLEEQIIFYNFELPTPIGDICS